MLLKIFPENPAPRHIKMVIEILNKGGIVIFPTDTIYGMGCSIQHIKTANRIAQIKRSKVTRFSVIVNNMSMLSDFTKPIDNHIFRMMKKVLPGPYTFILDANHNVPKIFHSKKKTIGIRMPDNNIINTIIEELGHPVITTSIRDDDAVAEYITDPELIHEKYGDLVDLVIDGGYGDNEPSTIIDCTEGEPMIIRQGKGIIEF